MTTTDRDITAPVLPLLTLLTPLAPPGDPTLRRDVMTSPFDELGPPPLARRAAEELQKELRGGFLASGLSASLLDRPGGGKMFGVLVVETEDGSVGFLRGFSGTIDGRFDVAGFAPPLFDRRAREAVELAGERVVRELTARAQAFEASSGIDSHRSSLSTLAGRHQREHDALRLQHAANRRSRREQRASLAGSPQPPAGGALVLLDQQSRRDKAERRLLGLVQAAERQGLQSTLLPLERRRAAHQRLHRIVSRRLMREIHDTYVVRNALGDSSALRELYAPGEPPAGAADCAAPKLLACAYVNGLRPLALAEFWWGAPPPAGGRIGGAFYPSCRDKCGPLLPFMMQGFEVAPPRRFEPPVSDGLDLHVVFEDEWIVVVDKPCGMLSVPPRGRVGHDCVLARLKKRDADALLAHRLDLDTSGLLVAARDADTHAALQRQFLRRTVEKRYVALVDGKPPASRGLIDLPIRVDVNDRPRQIHDPRSGRRAVTEWRVLHAAPAAAIEQETGGSERHAPVATTRVALFPRTGRTHQLRVHAAHPLGLGAPIVGDRLYGRQATRLMLHAEALAFVHPATELRVSFESSAPF